MSEDSGISGSYELHHTRHLISRMAQRGILQAEVDKVIRLGRRTEGEVHDGDQCWLYEYGGVTVVTNNSSTIGITAWKTTQSPYRELIRGHLRYADVYHEEDGGWQMYMRPNMMVRRHYDTRQHCWVYPERTFDSRRAMGIAVRKHIFGEGSERVVRRVREINSRGKFVGPPLVGKETRFVADLNSGDEVAFHKNFCKRKQLAQKYADLFNRLLLVLPGMDQFIIPLVNFLDCWVMVLTEENNRRETVLVEKMLDCKQYTKFNNNAGWVNDSFDSNAAPLVSIGDGIEISLEDIPQAYSHFTYLASRRRFLVCDLQGVLYPRSDGIEVDTK